MLLVRIPFQKAMNNFKGTIYDYYRKPPNPFSFHSSLTNQGELEQEETEQSDENNQLEKITDSKLVMFSPPKVESKQKAQNDSSTDVAAEERSAQVIYPNNEEEDKKETVYTLIKEFTSLLDNPTSVHDEFSTLQEEEMENDEILRDEKYSTLDEGFDESIANEEETIDMYEDTFITMLSDNDELPEENQDNTSSDLKETTSDQKEDLPKVEKNHAEKNEMTSSLYDHFHNQLTEQSPDEDEFSFAHEKTKDQHPLCNEIPSHKKKKKKKKKKHIINKNTPSKKTNLKMIDEEKPAKNNIDLIDCAERKQTTAVKMPVLLGSIEIDIDIMETIDLLMAIENISKVEWSIGTLDCKVLLPSPTVFLGGAFILDIECSNNQLENKIQSMKFVIPWSKTTTIHWLNSPELSYSSQKDFTFQSQHDHHVSSHYEFYQKFTEPIDSQLDQLNFVWHHELHSKDKQLEINGTAQMYIHFMQEQFVELERYSN